MQVFRRLRGGKECRRQRVVGRRRGPVLNGVDGVVEQVQGLCLVRY